MNIDDLLYNEIVVEDAEVAGMVDLLLKRLFGKGASVAIKDKETGRISFRFWSTEEEFNSIMNVVDKEIENIWDLDYQELLDAYRR